MLRLGIISEIGQSDNLGYARVLFDESNFVSGWLPLPSFGTKSTKQWIPVEVNSQVACLMDDLCEQGCIAMVLWSENDAPPKWANPNTFGVRFADGAEMYYDTSVHKLSVNVPNSELILICKKLNVQGEVNIKGATNVEGKISATDDVTAGDLKITLLHHRHPTAVGPSEDPIPSAKAKAVCKQ